MFIITSIILLGLFKSIMIFYLIVMLLILISDII
jgi:hypothetical protein